MAFNHKYNTDNVHSRAVIVGLINLLNNKIQYENRLSDADVDVVEVPWFPANSVDERFLQDYFTFWSDCIHPKLATGNYDALPRGVVTLQSKGIDSSSLTNRFVRGSYVKEIDGKLETFNSYINSLPLKFSFQCEVKAPSYLDAFKIEQSLMETFYKVQVFNVSFRGFRIPCQVGLPEDYGLEKSFEFSYGDNNETSLKFTLELETYFPVVDKTNERHESNRMQGFAPTVNVGSGETRGLSLLTPLDNTIGGGNPEVYYSGSTLPFAWETIGNVLRVDLEFSTDGGTNWKPIVKQLTNSNNYMWDVPEFQTSRPEAVLSQEVTQPANLRVIVGSGGDIIDIIIFDGGLGYNNTLTMTIEELGATITTPANIVPIVTNGAITGFTINDGGAGYTPSQQYNTTFRIKDSNIDGVNDTVGNILVI